MAASAAVHAGAAAGVAAFSIALPTGETTTPSEMDFVVLDAPLEPHTPLPPDVYEPTTGEVVTRPRFATVIPPTRSTTDTEPVIDTPVVDEPDPRREEDDEHPRSLVSLDPRSVAAAAFVFEDSPLRSVPAGRSRHADRLDEEALENALNGALAAAANARPHVSRRPAPDLRPQRDGSYVFHGHVFDAVIATDGTVRFSDQAGVAMNTPNLGPGGLLPTGSFDISNSIERARGQDPYRHERAWFMRETVEIRDRLADTAVAGERARGIARFNGDLRRIWAGRGTPAEKRARLFGRWDDCTEDEVGAHARTAVVEFVRRMLPQGSANGFSARELLALNRRRLSRESFQPYPR